MASSSESANNLAISSSRRRRFSFILVATFWSYSERVTWIIKLIENIAISNNYIYFHNGRPWASTDHQIVTTQHSFNRLLCVLVQCQKIFQIFDIMGIYELSSRKKGSLNMKIPKYNMTIIKNNFAALFNSSKCAANLTITWSSASPASQGPNVGPRSILSGIGKLGWEGGTGGGFQLSVFKCLWWSSAEKNWVRLAYCDEEFGFTSGLGDREVVQSEIRWQYRLNWRILVAFSRFTLSRSTNSAQMCWKEYSNLIVAN